MWTLCHSTHYNQQNFQDWILDRMQRYLCIDNIHVPNSRVYALLIKWIPFDLSHNATWLGGATTFPMDNNVVISIIYRLVSSSIIYLFLLFIYWQHLYISFACLSYKEFVYFLFSLLLILFLCSKSWHNIMIGFEWL